MQLDKTSSQFRRIHALEDRHSLLRAETAYRIEARFFENTLIKEG
jgi:hypothetical protein